MELLYIHEHLFCPFYETCESPLIQIVKLKKGDSGNRYILNNEIVCIIQGSIEYGYNGVIDGIGKEGQMVFSPSGYQQTYHIWEDSLIVIFRIIQPINLCWNYPIEKLYGLKTILSDSTVKEYNIQRTPISVLNMPPSIKAAIESIMEFISNGLHCHCWFELKITEVLLYLRISYTKEELYGFFQKILSRDTAFSEYIRVHWKKFKTVKEMAGSMNMTHKQFAKRFVNVFNQNPYEWMQQARARAIHKEILSTKKPFKEIALDMGFTDDTHFTRFCKQQLGKTPTDLRKNTEDGKN